MKAAILILLVIAYFLSPIDLIPDVLLPVGFLDDLGVAGAAIKAIKGQKA